MPVPQLTEIVGVPSLPPGATNLQITATLDPPYQGGPLIGLSASQYDGVRNNANTAWVFDTNNNNPFAFPMARKDIICPPPDGWMRVMITYTLGGKNWRAELKPLRPMAGDDGTLDLTTNQFPGGIIATTSLVSLVADTTAAKTAALAAAGTANAAAAAVPGQVTAGLAPVAPALAQVQQSLDATAQAVALATASAGIIVKPNLAAITGADGYYRAMDTTFVYQRTAGVNTRKPDLEALTALQGAALAPQTAATYAGIPAALDALRPKLPGNTVIGLNITNQATGTTYRVDAQPAYGTAGTAINYVLTPIPTEARVNTLLSPVVDAVVSASTRANNAQATADSATTAAANAKATADAANLLAALATTTISDIPSLLTYNGAAGAVVILETLRGGTFVKRLASVAGVADGGLRFAYNGGTTYVWQRVYGGIPLLPWYGVVPDNVTQTDNAAALLAMVNGLGAKGTAGIPANFSLGLSANSVVIPFGFAFVGAGKETSQVRLMGNSGEYFRVKSDSGVTFNGIGFVSAVPQTSGSVISLRGTVLNSMNAGTQVRDCSFLNHVCAVNAISAYGYTIRGNKFNNLAANGVSLRLNNIVNPDYGDGIVDLNDFHADPNAANTRAIQQLAGGGTRIVNNKFYKHTYAFNMYLTRGAGTGILFITGNSFESAGSISLLFEVEAAASAPWAASTAILETYDFRPTVNNGLVFYCVQAGVTGTVEPTWPSTTGTLVNDGTAIWVGFTDSQYFSKITIVGNQFAEDPLANIRFIGLALIKLPIMIGNQFIVGPNSIGIDLVSCVNPYAQGNMFQWDRAGTGGTGIQISVGGVYAPEIGVNNYKGIATTINDLSTRAAGILRALPAAVNWTTQPANTAPPQVIRTRQANTDMVNLSGAVGNNTAPTSSTAGPSAGGTLLATLPYGFCPNQYRFFSALILTSGGVQQAGIQIAPSGAITIAAPVLNPQGDVQAVKWISFDGIQFPAPSLA
ncbi:hypothetical protein [Deinococcus altitudinis]|uniref:hypothetical protein n=1 Tax=Deinococcus altitudinis TaxID=468914 RepID=UPI00389205D1